MLVRSHIHENQQRVRAGVIFFAVASAVLALAFSMLLAQEAPGSTPEVISIGSAPAQDNQPDLMVSSTTAFWSSYYNYSIRRLDVRSTLANIGSNDAFNVQLTGSSVSSGVQTVTAMPVTLGDIAAGASVDFDLQYLVPAGVGLFTRSLSATAADADGNVYSYPPPPPSIGDKIGISVGDHLAQMNDQELEAAMADIESLGVTWLRFDLGWNALQWRDADTYDWQRFDRIVDAAGRHNLKLMPILTYTPGWARRAECADSLKCAPADPARFAQYAAEVVARYAPQGVHNWEIWNEPNIDSFWKPVPDPAAYTQLLQLTYARIKTVDPDATVVSAGLAPTSNSSGRVAPRDFLSGMYQSGARDYFDVMGYHPYSYPALPSEVHSWSGWSQMSDLSPSIRSIMDANGDSGKDIWGTEYGVPTGGRGDVDEGLQAQAYRDAIQQMESKPWMSVMFFYTYKDMSNDPGTVESFFGMVRYDGTRKPAYYELRDILQNG